MEKFYGRVLCGEKLSKQDVPWSRFEWAAFIPRIEGLDWLNSEINHSIELFAHTS